MASSAYDGKSARWKSNFYKEELRANKNPLTKTKSIVSNAGIPTEAYFRNYHDNTDLKDGLWSVLRTDVASNYPPALNTASELWSSSYANKGALLRYKAPGKFNLDDGVAANATIAQILDSNIFYGFQFHYNPTTISMSYAGVPETDVTMYTSGTEKFNALGTGVSQSTISFNLLINRVFDMKYFDAKTGLFKSNVTKSMIAGKFPTPAEQKDIYNKGTMYDVEFLLRVIMGGVRMTSYLGRNASWDNKTADMGFLTGIPIELHLGKSLRYLGRIEAISLNHVLFTERMVPTFTEVAITLTRIPDHGGNTLANPSGEPVKPETSAPTVLFGAPSNPNGYNYIDWSQGKADPSTKPYTFDGSW